LLSVRELQSHINSDPTHVRLFHAPASRRVHPTLLAAISRFPLAQILVQVAPLSPQLLAIGAEVPPIGTQLLPVPPRIAPLVGARITAQVSTTPAQLPPVRPQIPTIVADVPSVVPDIPAMPGASDTGCGDGQTQGSTRGGHKGCRQ